MQPIAPSFDAQAAVQPVRQFYENLTADDVGRIATLYAPDACFKDPFNDVQGTAAIEAIFEHMFDSLASPRFVVTGQVCQGAQCFLTWEMRFRFKSDALSVERSVHGASHLQFDAQARVTWHRDYWDAAEELYEQLPLVGSLMRWLKRRMRGRGVLDTRRG